MSTQLSVKIRTWLLPKPRPATIRLTNGKKVDLLAVGGMSFNRLADTIEAMQPDLIEALTEEGAILRARRLGDFDDTEREPEEAAPTKAPASAYDPETVRFELFAKLIAEAYAHSNTVAFDRLAQIAEIGARRAEAAQKTVESYERARRAELEQRIADFQDQVESAGGDGNLLKDMITQFFGGQAAAGNPAAANGKGH